VRVKVVNAVLTVVERLRINVSNVPFMGPGPGRRRRDVHNGEQQCWSQRCAQLRLMSERGSQAGPGPISRMNYSQF